MVLRKCEHCSKIYAHRQSLFKHRNKCKRRKEQGNLDYNTDKRQRKVGCALDPDELLDMLHSNNEVQFVNKEVKDTDKTDIPMDYNKRFLDQLEKDKNEKFELFKDVTLKDKTKFMDLLAEVKSQTPDYDFKGLDELISEYFDRNVQDRRGIAEKLYTNLDGLRYDTMKVKFTRVLMQMILKFMEIKRNSLNILLEIVKSQDKKELWRNSARGVITNEETRRLEKDITKENIKKTIMDRDIDDWIK